MKKMIYTVLFIATGFLISSPVHAKTASEVFDAVSLSIVVILTWDVNGKNLGFGSGVVIPGGSVATSFHVVKDAAMIKVLYRQKEYQATLHYIDWDRDVCTLIGEDFNAPAVSMGSTSRLKVGKRVFAIGAPQGLELTLSEGIISGLRPVAGGQYIQTTASISPGSSGGGLFDEEGRLIGLTTFYLTEGQQLNFAVPVEWIDELPDRSKEIAKSSLIKRIPRSSAAGLPFL
jgi:S1-C subfamily serine protease